MLKKLTCLFKPRERECSPVQDFLVACAERRSVCRLDLAEADPGAGRSYLMLTDVREDVLALSSRAPLFSPPSRWIGAPIRLLLIVKGGYGRTEAVFRFSSRIVSVESEKRARAAIPSNLERAERRQSVRLVLKRRHQPDVTVWPICSDASGNGGPRIGRSPLVHCASQADDPGFALENLSRGGAGLSFSRERYEACGESLAPGKRAVLQLRFSGQAFARAYSFLFIVKVRNVFDMPELKSRVSVGLQFMALRRNQDEPGWERVNKTGENQIGRLVNALQLEYHKEAKRRLERLARQD